MSIPNAADMAVVVPVDPALEKYRRHWLVDLEFALKAPGNWRAGQLQCVMDYKPAKFPKGAVDAIKAELEAKGFCVKLGRYDDSAMHDPDVCMVDAMWITIADAKQ